MRRDLDLIRLILMDVEANDLPNRSIEIQLDGYSPEQISYHSWLLHDAGFVTAKVSETFGSLNCQPKALTWKGQDFLAATRNGSVWHQVKAKLAATSLDAPIAVIQQLAVKLVAGNLGLGDD